MSWTKVSKPTGANWTKVSTYRPLFDDPNVLFDDPSVFYDGINVSAWTNVPKPTGNNVILAGMATGLIMPPTYTRQVGVDPWTRVNKPTT